MAPSLIGIVLGFVTACVVADLRSRRIPNLLSVSAALAGVVLNAGEFGARGLLYSAGGLAATISLLLVPFALGGIGGGDVKMMGAVGALLGPRSSLVALGIGTVLGGVTAALHLARHGRLRETLRAMGRALIATVVIRSIAPLRSPAPSREAVLLPYSLPLALGTIGAIVMVGA
jgi:prepilin peptidase CpaA